MRETMDTGSPVAAMIIDLTASASRPGIFNVQKFSMDRVIPSPFNAKAPRDVSRKTVT